MRPSICLILMLLYNVTCKAQFLDDKINKDQTSKGLDYLYNQQFDLSKLEFAKVQLVYNSHPVAFMLNALQIQHENPGFEKNPLIVKRYLTELNKCIIAAKLLYKQPKFKKEATFYLLAAHGYVALSHSFNKDHLAAANEAKKAYNYFSEGKKYKNESQEFMFASGLYNFYRIQYPESHPIVKPIVFFFENGNRNLGLTELESSARNSIFSKVEAMQHLVNISIKYESNFKKALQYANVLIAKYPNNVIFKIKQIESLLLNSEFDAADKPLQQLKTKSDAISMLSSLVFEGYIEEHQNKNLNKALVSYARALKIKNEVKYTKDYHSLAYLGMARIFNQQNDKAKAKAFYKKCLEDVEYIWIKKAANAEIIKLK